MTHLLAIGFLWCVLSVTVAAAWSAIRAHTEHEWGDDMAALGRMARRARHESEQR